MQAIVDAGGRVVIPKPLRDALGLTPGTRVDISAYGSGVQITPGGRAATLAREPSGRLVVTGETKLTDEDLFALIDAGRK